MVRRWCGGGAEVVRRWCGGKSAQQARMHAHARRSVAMGGAVRDTWVMCLGQLSVRTSDACSCFTLLHTQHVVQSRPIQWFARSTSGDVFEPGRQCSEEHCVAFSLGCVFCHLVRASENKTDAQRVLQPGSNWASIGTTACCPTTCSPSSPGSSSQIGDPDHVTTCRIWLW